MKHHVVLDTSVHVKLRKRQLALSCLRPLSMQQVIELLVVKAHLTHEEVMAFTPSTKGPGRPRKPKKEQIPPNMRPTGGGRIMPGYPEGSGRRPEGV